MAVGSDSALGVDGCGGERLGLVSEARDFVGEKRQ